MPRLKAYHPPASALLTGAAMILAGCASGVSEPARVVRDAQGISVRPATGPAALVRVAAITPDVLRVTAFPSEDTVLPDSLIIETSSSAPFTVRETANDVTIRVSRASATVSLESGLVQFRNEAGEVVLEEDGRAEFIPVAVEGTNFYELQQRWNRGTREAFYGLGQHQQGQFNLNGEDVELAQHNIVIAMPFVVSDRNYGVLWDNNSLSRFGDPRPYGGLSDKLTVRDRDGNAGGLTASYRVDGKLVAQRVETDPNYQFLGDQDHWPDGLAQDTEGLTVTWEGSIEAASPGVHRFRIYQSGYTRVTVDGELVVDSWRQNWNPWHRTFDVDLQPGRAKSLRIEWQVDGGYLRLLHQDPLPADERHSLNLYSELGQAIDYYFIGGTSLDDVVAGYRELTGRSRILPRWAYGFWQSRERYRSQDELLDVLREYRRRGIPIDNIVLDWFYWEENAWGSHEFDASHFPDPGGMVDAVHDLNARIMISVWPKFYPTTRHYRELEAIGAVYPHTIETGQVDWVGPGYVSTFYDPYSADARQLYWRQIEENLGRLGFDAWWMDATEPDLGSNADIDERKARMTPTALGPGAAFFNSYALMNAQAVFDGLKASEPDKRVMILTRSGFPGLQRFGAATWSGDIASTWADFRDQVPAGLGMSLAGLANWTFDIGGFTPEPRYAGDEMSSADRDEWRELNTRWFQFGAFAPLFRSHGQYPFREIFNIADEGSTEYASMVWHAKLRYRLLPYIYSLAGDVSRKHGTIMRPLVMDFPDDPVVKDLGNQYLFGPSILVKPVTEFRAREVDVYLPGNGEWLDFHSGERYRGGQWIRAAAPLDRMPLYVRAGSILPVGPAVQYSDQALSAPITLLVYTGSSGRFEFYEDDGESSAYLQGQSSLIPMTYNEQEGLLTIGARVGSWSGMPEERRFDVRWIDQPGDSATTFDAPPDASVDYRGERITIRRNR